LQPHPHIHCVVPGGGLSPDHGRWLSAGSPIEDVANCFRSVAFFSRTWRKRLLPLFSVSPQSGNAPAAMDPCPCWNG
jgi:hypothetical protein